MLAKQLPGRRSSSWIFEEHFYLPAKFHDGYCRSRTAHVVTQSLIRLALATVEIARNTRARRLVTNEAKGRRRGWLLYLVGT